jgi:hypothetical protein
MGSLLVHWRLVAKDGFERVLAECFSRECRLESNDSWMGPPRERVESR